MSRHRLPYLAALSIVMLLGKVATAQESDLNQRELDTPIAGVFKIPNLNIMVFEVRDQTRPRLGWVIELNAEDEADAVDNFKYCDGTTARLELSALVESSRNCDNDQFGNTLKFTSIPLGSPVIVLAGAQRVDGKIVSIAPSDSGGFVGIVEFSKPELLADFNKVIFDKDGLLFSTISAAEYTQSDMAILQGQWVANGGGIQAAMTKGLDLGVGSVVGVTSWPESTDLPETGQPQPGILFSYFN